MSPTLASGKVCYLEIPAVDIDRSADFYSKVFGWRLRRRTDGHLAFDDAPGEVRAGACHRPESRRLPSGL